MILRKERSALSIPAAAGRSTMWPSRQRVTFRFVVRAMLIMDRVRGDERPREPSVDAQAADGEHLLQALPEAAGGAGVSLIEQAREVLGVPQAKVRVGVDEGLHELRVDPGLLPFWQVIGDVSALVQGAALHGCEATEDFVHGRRQGLRAVHHDQQPVVGRQAAGDQVGQHRPDGGLVLRRAVPQPDGELAAVGGDAQRHDDAPPGHVLPIQHQDLDLLLGQVPSK